MRDNLLGALIIALLAILLFSDRAWFAANRPVIAPVAEVKIPPEIPDPESLIDAAGVHVPWQRSKAQQLLAMASQARGIEPPAAALSNQTPPRFGYSVREVTFLGMPFGWYREWGDVLYTSSDWGVVAMPLSAEGIALLNKANGRDITRGYLYPFWLHLWGWLFVAGAALWGWLQYRYLVRKREAEGII